MLASAQQLLRIVSWKSVIIVKTFPSFLTIRGVESGKVAIFSVKVSKWVTISSMRTRKEKYLTVVAVVGLSLIAFCVVVKGNHIYPGKVPTLDVLYGFR